VGRGGVEETSARAVGATRSCKRFSIDENGRGEAIAVELVTVR
jgi:hypothetical protein